MTQMKLNRQQIIAQKLILAPEQVQEHVSCTGERQLVIHSVKNILVKNSLLQCL